MSVVPLTYEEVRDREDAWFRQDGAGWHRGHTHGSWCGVSFDFRVAQTALKRPSEMPLAERCRACLVVEVESEERRIAEINAEIADLAEDRRPYEERRDRLVAMLTEWDAAALPDPEHRRSER